MQKLRHYFIIFLKKNRCYNQFVYNLEHQKSEPDFPDRNVDSLIMRRGSSLLILHSFVWEKTPQGERYWDSMNQQWEKFYHKIVNKYKNNTINQ